MHVWRGTAVTNLQSVPETQLACFPVIPKGNGWPFGRQDAEDAAAGQKTVAGNGGD